MKENEQGSGRSPHRTPVQTVQRTTLHAERGGVEGEDRVAVEEPLEIRIQGSAYAVLLRTPGDERELIAGFLASEDILHGAEDLAAISPCPGVDVEGNYWNVALAEGVSFEQERRKASMVGSTCGLCGVRTIDEIQDSLPTPSHGVDRLADDFFAAVEQQVRERQQVRDLTAGVHAAALVDPTTSTITALAEDVGRHNAVDKVLGAQLLADDYPLERSTVLWVSGRLSFEIVQKAAIAGVAVVVGLGVPTSLAIGAADKAGLSLFGVARPTSVNRYCGNTTWAGAES